MAIDLAIRGWRSGGPPVSLRDPWLALFLGLGLLSLGWWVTDTTPVAVAFVWKWAPALALGMGTNIQISVVAMALGTVLGLVIGVLSLSPGRGVRLLARWYVLSFRNAPLLVLIFFTTYVFPFEIVLGAWRFPFPDWVKAALGLALPASANVAEIFRGAIQSIPSAQGEAARSLALSRAQVFRLVILPQCVGRMLPSWMNLYASITMGTSLASLVGVHDVVQVATQASHTVQRVDCIIMSYVVLLLIFFVYCYPLSRVTRYLERRHEHA
ncbi:amino acid ABC transporter permease [Pararhodospirillum photometricum]|uniref:Amino acid ABC transporter, permease protein n=1 Tax=Pararhodospirillum photometricum DSM 122 TaxID=1150469 RepID=H6SKV4_PARPM|nr:amino acid ABC transporter permease [Pararhodospirillum photometricum]CCG08619.1 Amino acid ABC transporter, permease protein [Pararhodospirillum photometricum DSM 122]